MRKSQIRYYPGVFVLMNEILVSLASTDKGRIVLTRVEIYAWQIIAQGAGIMLQLKPYRWIAVILFAAMFITGYFVAMWGF